MPKGMTGGSMVACSVGVGVKDAGEMAKGTLGIAGGACGLGDTMGRAAGAGSLVDTPGLFA